MSNTIRGYLKIIFISILTGLFLLAVSFVLFLKIYIPNEVEVLIEKFARENGYKIKINELSIGLLSGLSGDKIEIFESKNLELPILTLKKFSLNPGYLDSLLKRKFIIEELVIEDPVITVDKVNLKNIKGLISKTDKGSEGEEGKQSSLIKLERVRIVGSEMEVTKGILLKSKSLDFTFSGDDLYKVNNIKILGSISYLEGEANIHGLIKFSKGIINGDLNINIESLNTDHFPIAFPHLSTISLLSDIKIQIADKVSSEGVIKLVSTDKESIGNVVFGLSYDTKSDAILLNSAEIDLGELNNFSLNGGIEEVTGKGIINVSGHFLIRDPERLESLFPFLSKLDLSGAVDVSELKLIGSIRDKNLSLEGAISLNGVNINSSEDKFSIPALASKLYFKKIFGKDESGLSIDGDFDSDRVVTKFGEIEGFSGRLSCIVNNSWNSANLHVSLRDIESKFFNGTSIKISKLSTSKPFIISLLDNNGATGKSRLIASVKNTGLAYEKLLFNDLEVDRGNVSDLFVGFGGERGLQFRLSSSGFKFHDRQRKIILGDFRVNINSDEDEKFSYRGEMEARDARYDNLHIPHIAGSFWIGNDTIKIANMIMEIETVGALKTSDLNIKIGNKGEKRVNKIHFTNLAFEGFDNKINSDGIEGEINFLRGNDSKVNWDGRLYTDVLNIKSQPIEKLTTKLKSIPGGMKFYDVKGSIFDGTLQGDLIINNNNSYTNLETHFLLKDVTIPSKVTPIHFESVSLDFNGGLDGGFLPLGNGSLLMSGLRMAEDLPASNLKAVLKFEVSDETLLIKEGYIQNKEKKMSFEGKLHQISKKERSLKLDIKKFSLPVAKSIFYPILPGEVRDAETNGDVEISFLFDNFLTEDSSLRGKVKISNSACRSMISGTPIYMSDVNGVITIKENIESHNPLISLMRRNTKLDKGLFKDFQALLETEEFSFNGDYLNIGSIEYGFLRLNDIKCNFELSDNELNLRLCSYELFGGEEFTSGFVKFGGGEGHYNISFLSKDISLEAISGSVPSIKDYISGRFNGLGWINGVGSELGSINGLFDFWSKKSKEEFRRIGKALLQKLGAKGRLFIGSSKSYDKGLISGYIKDGIITFKELNISNEILGFKNLSIQVDPRRNTISIKHLLSVIREISKRAGSGKLQIETENTKH